MNVINTGDRGSAHPGIRQDPITAHTPAERRSALLEAVRTQCLEHLLPALKTLFDNVDDLLFDLARKSVSYVVQRAYFEAMQEIRRKRTDIEALFESRFLTVFDHLHQRTVALAPIPPAATGLKSGPADDDSMREQLAIANLIEKVQVTCHEDIFALNRRLGILLGNPELATGENPAGPATIGEAIKAVISLVRAGGFIRLLVLSLFDRHLMEDIQVLYRALNQFLVNQQVLPEICIPIKVPDADAAIPGTALSASYPAPIIRTLHTDLLSLLTGISSAGIPSPPTVFNIDWVHGLTLLQRGGYSSPNGMADGVTFSVVRDIKTRGLLPGLDRADEATLDIVAMLFDYLLSDKRLPEILRSHIARLQIPLLKITFLDRDFLIVKSHPARRLLNTITRAGIKSDGDAIFQEALINLIGHTVQRILNEFEEDMGLFIMLQIQLEQGIAAIQRERSLRAGRTARISEDSTRQEQAKHRIRVLIDARLDHARPALAPIPEALRNFILTHWQHLLILLFVEHGESSPLLNEAISTMDDLIWSVAPKQDAAGRDQLNRLRPDLIQRLNLGMDRLSLPPFARTGFLNKLARCHAKAVAPQSSKTAALGTISEDDSLAIAAALLEDPLKPAAEEFASPPSGEGGEGRSPRQALSFDSPVTTKKVNSEDVTTPRDIFLNMVKTTTQATATVSSIVETQNDAATSAPMDPARNVGE